MDDTKKSIAKILADNERFLKVSVIEKEMGLKPTVLKRMVARNEIPEKFKEQVEAWWGKFIADLNPLSMAMEFFSSPASETTGEDFAKLFKATEAKEENYIGDKSKKFLAISDEAGQWTDAAAGEPVTITLTEKNHFVKMFTPIEQPIDKYGNMPPTPEGLKKQKSSIDKRQYPLEDFEKQIETIKAEKIPKERDTKLGRMSWQAEQEKRISQLQNKLNGN